jgi:hypothetical protein
MWCKPCQQDVRAIMLPTEMGDSPHCPRCGSLLRLATPRPEAIVEMAEASGDFLLARRGLPVSLVSSAVHGDYGQAVEGQSITLTAPRGRHRADISIDWQWDEDRRALRRIHASLEGGAMYRFDRAHLPNATISDSHGPVRQENSPEMEKAKSGNPVAGGLLFVGLAALSAGAAFFAHGLWASGGTLSGLGMPLVVVGQTLITFSLLFQMDGLRRGAR